MKKLKFFIIIFLLLSTITLPCTLSRPVKVTYRYESLNETRASSTDSWLYEKIQEKIGFNYSSIHRGIFWYLHYHLNVMPGTLTEVRTYHLAFLVMWSTLTPRIFKQIILCDMKSISHLRMKEIRSIYTESLATANKLMKHELVEIPIPTTEIRNLPRRILP